MNIQEKIEGSTLTFCIEGNLDTMTAPVFEERISDITEEIKEVVFDFSKLDYISSAGLRTMLNVRKRLGEGGVVKVKNANEMVRDVLHTTGFSKKIELE